MKTPSLLRRFVSIIIFWGICVSFNSDFCYGQKLYLFSEGDVHDENVGKCVEVGTSLVMGTVKLSMPWERLVVYNDPFEDDEVVGTRWTGPNISTSYNVKDDILEAIERCPAGSNDAIFFYWCGHGAFDEDGHFLWLPKNRGAKAMRRSEILDALKKKNVRLVVFITESCHVLQSFPVEEQAPAAPPPMDEINPLFRSLFFNCSGVVDINSSSPGQTSGANEKIGGIFTYFLCNIFFGKLDSRLTWKKIIDSIDRTIPEKYGRNQKIYVWSLPKEEGSSSESRPNDWSEPIYHPENGDRIIAVDDVKVNSEAEFRNVIKAAEDRIVLTIVDRRSGNLYYLIADLLPPGSVSRLGIYVSDTNSEGVVVTGVVANLPGNHCRYLQNGDTQPVGNGARTSGQSSNNGSSSGWTAPIYHPENGDRIIAVNGTSVANEAEFRQAVGASSTTIDLTLIENDGGRCHLRTQLRPKGNQTRLGIYVSTSSQGGVVVTGVMPGTPGMKCQYRRD